MKTRLYYDYYENTLNIYDDSSCSTRDRVGPPSGESVYKDYCAGFNVHMFWDITENNRLRCGVMGKKDIHRETMEDDPYDRYESRTYSFSAEDIINAGENLVITLGAGFDLFEKTSREEPIGVSMESGDNLRAFSPLAGVVYSVSEDVDLFGGYARKVRFPTMRNLYAAGVVGPKGNPDLKEEKADKFELGANWRVAEKARIDGAIFYNEIKDHIQFDNLIGRFEQFEKARMQGVELTVSGDITESLFGRIGYTWLRTKIDGAVVIESERGHDDLVYRPDELSYRPDHKVDVELRKTFAWDTTVGVHGSYISSRIFYNHADPGNNNALVAEKKSRDGYFLLNARIAHPVTRKITIELLGENLFNEEYQDIYLFPAKGLTVWGGVRVDL